MSNSTVVSIVLFLDTYGNVWETCTANCEGAENFGPRYCAKPSTVHPDNLIHLFEEEAGFELFRPMTEEELSATEEWNRRHTDDCGVCEGTGCPLCRHVDEEVKTSVDNAGTEPYAEFIDKLDGPLWELRAKAALRAEKLSDEVDANCKGYFEDDDIPF